MARLKQLGPVVKKHRRKTTQRQPHVLTQKMQQKQPVCTKSRDHPNQIVDGRKQGNEDMPVLDG